MIYVLVSYFLTTFIFFVVMQRRRSKYLGFPKLNISSHGISFDSASRHRIKIGKAKVMQIENTAYLKSHNKIVTICNITDLYIKKDYLYFTSNGKCIIKFTCGKLEKYFNISIYSHMFNLNELKQKTLTSMLNNIFQLNKCEELKKYLNIVKTILKIEVTKTGVTIKQNQLKLAYTVEYYANNIKKVVHVNKH